MYHLVNELNIMIMIVLLLSLLLYISEGSLEICQGIAITINTIITINHSIIIIIITTTTNTSTVTNTNTITIITIINTIIIRKLCIIRSYHGSNKDDRHEASSLEAC